MHLKKGDSFLSENKQTSHGQKRHLMIIISDPNPAGNVLVVPVTSLNPDLKQETHLVLKRGDHPFIKHDSVLAYSRMQIFILEYIQEFIQKGIFIAKETISPALLKKIQEAVKKSTAISKQTVKFFDFF